MISSASLHRVRAVADAVLYEGYLLYPYRANSAKNQQRWQFGVLGPAGAKRSGMGEESAMDCQTLMRAGSKDRVGVRITLRFLQIQVRGVERVIRGADGASTFAPVRELTVGGTSWLSWDEAVEREFSLEQWQFTESAESGRFELEIDGGTEVEEIRTEAGELAGRVVRTRWPARALVTVEGENIDGLIRLRFGVENVTTPKEVDDWDKDSAIRRSLIGAHLILAAEDTASFVSLLEPPADAETAAATCLHHRCYPVLAGLPGETDLVLVSPIILYDHPEVAAHSDGALFDATEIDEILTLRVMTLTEEEKSQARATDPLAAQIIDRCEQLSPASLARMHGVLREADLSEQDRVAESAEGVPWWDPAADTAVHPELDGVLVDGITVARGSVVRLRPSRCADAQDLFFSGQEARVMTVHADVDGGTHIGVVLVEDPAADLHEWYGRYLYFAPDEVEPIPPFSGEDERS